jgi:AraC-like DNA-binding protein
MYFVRLIMGISLFVCLMQPIGTLFVKKEKSISYRWFLGYCLVIGTILLAYILNILNLDDDNSFLNIISLFHFSAIVALPPMMYLYVNALKQDFTNDNQKNAKFNHFLPSFILLVINIFSFTYFKLASTNHVVYVYIENIMMYSNIIALYFIFLIQVLLYSALSIKEYQDYQKLMKNIFSFEEGITFKWIKIFIFIFIFFVFSVYLIQATSSIDNGLFALLILAYLTTVNYYAFKQEHVFQNLVKIKVYTANDIEYLLDEDDNKEDEINLESEALVLLSQKITKIMEQDKIYLDPDLTLGKLSNALTSNSNYVSSAINTIFKKNFSTYINEYRITETIDLIHSDESGKYTIEAIAEQAGFKSRSVFITAFKKTTGLTPSEFKKKGKS